MYDPEVESSDYRRRLGVTLEAARTYRRLTKEDAAAQIDVDGGTLGRWEAGSHAPNLEKVVRLARLLDLPDGWLFDPPETADEVYEGLALRAAQQRRAARGSE